MSDTNTTNNKSGIAMHVGEFLKQAFIEPLGLSLEEAAYRCGTTESTLSRLLNKKSNLTPELAVKLEKGFGRTAESWMNIQTLYLIHQVKKSNGDSL